jgi:glycosyltransferase involved in cell wall biosynthesis
MTESISISVVIPYYNSQKTIVRALDSALAQTKKVNEIILVNDGSVDDGPQIVENYIDNNMEINFKHISFKINQGQSAARNEGAKISSSQYIAFLDADDAWNPQKNEIQVKYLKENPGFKVIACKMDYLKDSSQWVKPINEKLLTVRKIGFLNQVFRLINLHTPGLIIERHFFNEIKMYDNYGFMEDWHLHIKASMINNILYVGGKSLAYVFKPFYGVSGLTSNLMSTQKVELIILKRLYSEKSINIIILIFATILSLIRFIKRLVITSLRKNYTRL